VAKSNSKSKKVAAKKTDPKAKKAPKKARKSANARGKKKIVPPFPDDDFELTKAPGVPQVPPFPDDDHEL
jgi:hypothetical protein